MKYLEKFALPTWEQEDNLILNSGFEDRYPCDIFNVKELERIDFAPITIIYGGNGSGKSTLLNLIAEKLKLERFAPFNKSDMFEIYLEYCEYDTALNEYGAPMMIPERSAIITSDDIFDYMLSARMNNGWYVEDREAVNNIYNELYYGKTVRMKGIHDEDFEKFKAQVFVRRKKSSNKFSEAIIGEKMQLKSNGETALQYFSVKLADDKLFCLDEPENSLSPMFQLQLAQILQDSVRFFGCQLIIATHSPFLLALKGAKIYDLNSTPVMLSNWWELENTKTYFDFFYKHRDKFLK